MCVCVCVCVVSKGGMWVRRICVCPSWHTGEVSSSRATDTIDLFFLGGIQSVSSVVSVCVSVTLVCIKASGTRAS